MKKTNIFPSNIQYPLVLHQDGLNSLSYNGLKTPIIIAPVYDIF